MFAAAGMLTLIAHADPSASRVARSLPCHDGHSQTNVRPIVTRSRRRAARPGPSGRQAPREFLSTLQQLARAGCRGPLREPCGGSRPA